LATTYAGPWLDLRGLHVRWLDDSPLGIFLRCLDRQPARYRGDDPNPGVGRVASVWRTRPPVGKNASTRGHLNREN
jgi:hypothetical protein